MALDRSAANVPELVEAARAITLDSRASDPAVLRFFAAEAERRGVLVRLEPKTLRELADRIEEVESV